MSLKLADSIKNPTEPGTRATEEASARRAPVKRWGLLALLALAPMLILVRGYDSGTGFQSLLLVGTHSEPTALPELRESAPPTDSLYGYDGQFYAQLALDPLLQRPDELALALDLAGYRAQKIGMPILAFGLGLGVPAAILHIYPLLNFGFWLALLFALWRYNGLARPRDWLLAASLLLTTGTLTSLSRSLTDFPALALAVMAIWPATGTWRSATLLSCACLVRETAILQIPAVSWPKRLSTSAWRHGLIWVGVLLPAALWSVYVRAALPPERSPFTGRFQAPFFALAEKLMSASQELATNILAGRDPFNEAFELLAVLGLLVQAVYLIRWPRFEAATWRVGAGFVLLVPLLSDGIWGEQYAFCRALLPMTAAFNLTVHSCETGRRYVIWFVAGNLGLSWMWLRVLFF
jgi:hypothetical protein